MAFRTASTLTRSGIDRCRKIFSRSSVWSSVKRSTDVDMTFRGRVRRHLRLRDRGKSSVYVASSTTHPTVSVQTGDRYAHLLKLSDISPNALIREHGAVQVGNLPS